MTDAEAGFMAKILSEPFEDTHRLVYADWLEEKTGRHAIPSFIRDQIAGVPRCVPLSLLARAETFLGAQPHECGITGFARECEVSSSVYRKVIYRRGFVDEIRCNVRTFLEHAEAMFKAHPITRVVLTNVTPDPDSPRSSAKFHLYCHEHYEEGNGSSLPSILFDALPGYSTLNTGGRYFRDSKGYPSAERANGDVSITCVNHGRALAGLDPLEVMK